jgi:periplasmic protein TonB
MKTLICAVALFACAYTCSAQVDTLKKQVSAEPDTSSFGAFRKVQFESEFPGGREGWAAFLQKNLVYPRKAVRQRIEGEVVLEFIVCTDGTVCDIRAISGPEELRESAVAALKSGGKKRKII